MDIVSLVIQVISGVVGGNAAGMSKQSMGPLLNSIFGGVGGVIVGQILAAITSEPGPAWGLAGRWTWRRSSAASSAVVPAAQC